ncbi:Tn3 family transposase [Paenibacillus humicola]|uniref:Tn3 family transposase n=1 Tax=Paenibacillus humicola TaxID=3110540 RepID=UPI003B83246C
MAGHLYLTVEKNYMDSHGRARLRSLFVTLWGYQLMTRLKAINSQKLYRPRSREMSRNMNNALSTSHWERKG